MKIDKIYKLEKVASKDKTREAINHICIDTEANNASGMAIATNSKTLAIVPIELETTDDVESKKEMLLPVKAFTEARKIGGKVLPESNLKLNGKIELSTGETMPYPETTQRYPNYKQVIPDPFHYGEVSFSPKLLWELCQAMGCEESVKMRLATKQSEGSYIIDGLQPIQLFSGKEHKTGKKAEGVLMPLRQV